MKYLSGEEVLIGDRIRVDGLDGVVVCVIDTNQFSDENPKEQWSYLEKGMMVEAEQMGLVHYPEMDEDISFVAREESES